MEGLLQELTRISFAISMSPKPMNSQCEKGRTAAVIPAAPAPRIATLVLLHLPYGEASDGVRRSRRDRTSIVERPCLVEKNI